MSALENIVKCDGNQDVFFANVRDAAAELKSMQGRIAELERQLKIACYVKADDPVGFDEAVLDRINELEGILDTCQWIEIYDVKDVFFCPICNAQIDRSHNDPYKHEAWCVLDAALKGGK